VTASLQVLWHDLECGGYREDLSLWHELARQAAGPVLDVGAGAGRVTLELAGAGTEVVALDADPALCDALRERAAGLPVEVVCADARAFALGRRFPLVIVPMQTVQLLEGPAGRAAFLRCARAHLAPGGLLAVAIADPLESSEWEAAELPRPDEVERDGVHYVSQPLSVADDGDRAAIHRVRQVLRPDGSRSETDNVIWLDRVPPATFAAEAVAAGLTPAADRHIPQTDEYIGSTVVVVRAP
jgi:SAM-dependent methyltransferase